MREDAFRKWLASGNLIDNSIRTAISRVNRLEAAYGDLELHYSDDRLEGLIEAFSYSAADEHAGISNQTRIVIDGNVRQGLASLKKTLRRYQRFEDEAKL